jgi:hypothetical protein
MVVSKGENKFVDSAATGPVEISMSSGEVRNGHSPDSVVRLVVDDGKGGKAVVFLGVMLNDRGQIVAELTAVQKQGRPEVRRTAIAHWH